jgi:hypothetical protein
MYALRGPSCSQRGYGMEQSIQERYKGKTRMETTEKKQLFNFFNYSDARDGI